MPITEAMSRSAALTEIPSSSTRQASFTTGRNIISMISFSGNFTSCFQEQIEQKIQMTKPSKFKNSLRLSIRREFRFRTSMQVKSISTTGDEVVQLLKTFPS